MFRIDPIEISDAIILSSSLAEDEHPAWAPGAFVKGNRVRRPNHRVYEALIDIPASATAPELDLSDPPVWLDISATNKFQPFDYYLADQAVGANISYTLAPGVPLTSLLVFNTRCESLSVVVTREGVTLMDASYPMQHTPTAVDFFSWVMATPETIPEIAIALVYLPGAEIEITFHGADVAVGQIVLGYAEDMGGTCWGTSITDVDYSTIAPNEYGVRKIKTRDGAFDINFHISAPTSDVPRIKEKVKQSRGKVAAYIGTLDALYGTMVLGVKARMELEVANVKFSTYQIQVEGLI